MEKEIKRLKKAVDAKLESYLQKKRAFPAVIYKAVKYSVAAGGKRIRPLLMLLAGKACGFASGTLMPFACAIEMIHTYSLIHDDLPAMDNDDLRRGKPTCHVKFGEANAILAGDALLTKAFETALSTPCGGKISCKNLVKAASLLAVSAGIDGMVGGQAADMLYEGKKAGIGILRKIHAGKTGALIRASALIPAVLAGLPAPRLRLFESFGEKIGLAFQISDDILDATADSNALGKTAGKDEKTGKSTYPSIYGVERSEEIARKLMLEASGILCKINGETQGLKWLAEYVVSRRN